MECAMRDCERNVMSKVTVTFINKEDELEEESFGYCSGHWNVVKNYYKNSKDVEVKINGK